MKVQISEITPVKKALKVEIPLEVVSKAFSNAYSDLNRRVKVPGFRPGKVPVALLEKRYGGSVTDDIIRTLVPDYYQKAVKETGISPVEFPSFEKVIAKKSAPISFTATVEVRPSITLSEYKGMVLSQKEVAVTQDDIDKALTSQQEAHGQLEACPDDHPVVSLDYVIINFEGAINGNPIKEGRQEGYTLQVGSDTFPPPFESSLLGKKKGDALEVDVPYPEAIQNKEIAGKTVHFHITLEEIKKKVFPPLDDEFAKDLGHADLSAFREEIERSLLEQRKVQREQEQKKELINQLISLHSFEVPTSLVARELNAMMSSFPDQNLSDEKRASLLKDLEPVARHRVQESLILDELAKKEGISVSDQEIDSELELIAKKRQMSSPEAKRLFYQKEGAIEGLKSQMREQKALDFIYSNARFEAVVEKGEES